MAEEKQQINDLAKLLDETLVDFDRRKVTDDDLDDIMADYDKTAVQKSAEKFDSMLSQLSEQVLSKTDDASGSKTDIAEMSDSELMNLFNMMKSDFFAQDMSPMIRSTADKYDTYLTEKSDSLTPEQKENYEKQREQLRVIADEYAKSEPENDDEMKRRLEEVKKLWLKLQEFGDPPVDLFSSEQMTDNCTIC